MKLIRVKNDYGVDCIKDQFLDDPDITKEDLASGIKQWLREAPNNIFLLSAWEGEDKVRLKSFILAFAPLSQKHVFVHQAWSDPMTPSIIGTKIFYALCQWAQSQGRVQIRCETLRDPLAFHRKWGFESYSQVLKLDLDEQWEDRLLRKMGEQNEKQQSRDQKHIDPVEATEASVEPARDGAIVKSRTDLDTVSECDCS